MSLLETVSTIPEEERRILAGLPPDQRAKALEFKAKGISLAREIERSNKSRTNFVDFFESTFLVNARPSKAEPMQIAMGNKLSEISDQIGIRQRFKKPPRHGSSVMLKDFVPFILGKHPDHRIRLLTYSETHSERFSATIKSIMESSQYKSIFPNKESHLSNYVRAGEWSTNAGRSRADGEPSFMALGLGSGFVGMGADWILIDDIYKNKEEAFSDATNEKIWGFHKEVLIPRLTVESNVIVSFHPWNERDYGSRLSEEGGWDEMRFPAICDSLPDPCGRNIGESLSPRYPVEYLTAIRDGGMYKGKKVDGMGQAAFESLYQGNATSREGSLYKLGMFKFVKDFRREPDSLFFLGCDSASSEEQSADRTSLTLLYKRMDGTCSWVKSWWGRYSPSGTTQFIYNVCKEANEKYGIIAPILPFIEEPPGQGAVYTDSIATACNDFGMRTERVNKDKITRALPLIAAMEIGNVDIVEGALTPEMQDELLGFPSAKHDDLNDGATLAFNCASQYSLL